MILIKSRFLRIRPIENTNFSLSAVPADAAPGVVILRVTDFHVWEKTMKGYAKKRFYEERNGRNQMKGKTKKKEAGVRKKRKLPFSRRQRGINEQPMVGRWKT